MYQREYPVAILILLPTYNERENIEVLLKRLFDLDAHWEILVVDDGSPDGTGDYVQALARTEDRLSLIRRSGKSGLGTAYACGYRFAIERGADAVVGMDADFSRLKIYERRLLTTETAAPCAST